MLDDKFAEHIPGCNMSFRKALDDIGDLIPSFALLPMTWTFVGACSKKATASVLVPPPWFASPERP